MIYDISTRTTRKPSTTSAQKSINAENMEINKLLVPTVKINFTENLFEKNAIS